ncbi:MAG: aminoacyl-tRNA hydrolase [Acidimicrobiales bacterium]|nr:aminoacyl-tRNA hydrolase [Acidimicrobiales bacterium]MCB9371451.1 aminoacyl-tRNA hydrolase [Microthrixaceae bacterium]
MANRLRVAPDCEIALAEVEWSFAPSGGPGGQHANKAHTRAVARLDLEASASLTDEQRRRLVGRLGPVVTVAADDSRSQHRNRGLALDRLRDLLAGALRVEATRRPSRPTAGSRRRRLAAKRRRSELKQARRPPEID